MTTRAKHILFSLIPVILLLLLIVAAEVTLRAFDVAPPPPLVTEVRYDGFEWYQTNRAYLAKYFPAGTPLIPEFKTTLFRKEKGPRTYRIMCLGSSSMFGTPYDMNANIPGIVRKQLRHLYPDIEFEVINWGASAINSNVVRDFAPLLLSFHPDLRDDVASGLFGYGRRRQHICPSSLIADATNVGVSLHRGRDRMIRDGDMDHAQTTFGAWR